MTGAAAAAAATGPAANGGGRYPARLMRRFSFAVEPWVIAAFLASAYLVVQPATADLAAQVYRTQLFEREGFTLWNGAWYAGHHTPGYSVLFPPLASFFGLRVVGAVSAIASALLFERLAVERFGKAAWIGAVWFGAATATNLFTGRLTFGLGIAFGLACLLAAQRGRLRLAVALGVLCPLASPVAGLFLALAGAAHALAHAPRGSRLASRSARDAADHGAGGSGDTTTWRTGAWIAAAGLLPAMAMSIAFPEGGTEPFVLSAFWPAMAFCAAFVVFAPREQRTLRIGVGLYAIACVGAYVLHTPMGGNATRLGALFGGPLLACALYPNHRRVLFVLMAPLLFWQWSPPVRDLLKTREDPSLHAAYFQPLDNFLTRQGAPTGRVEIVPTRNKWEAAYVADRYPMARGWERQLDLKYNRLFYRPVLTPAAYRTWLDDASVRFVALPDVRLDYAAKKEARLIVRGLPYLKLAWRNAHWRVYEVHPATPLVSGPAKLGMLGPDFFTLNASGTGNVLVRVHWTSYWALAQGAGCVERAPNDLTRVRPAGPGPIRVVARFAPGRVFGSGPRCRSAAA
jgi:hypothetical protein